VNPCSTSKTAEAFRIKFKIHTPHYSRTLLIISHNNSGCKSYLYTDNYSTAELKHNTTSSSSKQSGFKSKSSFPQRDEHHRVTIGSFNQILIEILHINHDNHSTRTPSSNSLYFQLIFIIMCRFLNAQNVT
jgi:hypothetical protein